MRLWLLLLALWLLLNESVAPGDVALGAAVAGVGVLAYAGLKAPGAAARRPLSMAVLAWLVLVDIVRSNLAVARLVLNPGLRNRTAGFLTMALEVRHPGALAVMACIITATPGTSWARYDAARNLLTIHVLDLVDERAWIAQFKERYERRLLEIFQ